MAAGTTGTKCAQAPNQPAAKLRIVRGDAIWFRDDRPADSLKPGRIELREKLARADRQLVKLVLRHGVEIV